MLIYCIDDDPDWQTYYQNLLGKKYELRHFPDGVSAIEAIDDQPPHAILLDMLLAGPSAVSLLAELQSYPDLATIPIAIISGVAITTDMSAYGVSRIFDKSTMQPQELLHWLGSVSPLLPVSQDSEIAECNQEAKGCGCGVPAPLASCRETCLRDGQKQ